MNKTADVIFAYSPKNDDELELTVGDKIEVIGFVEEGKLNDSYYHEADVHDDNKSGYQTYTINVGSSPDKICVGACLAPADLRLVIGWWKGKLKGSIGVFPSNFVKVVEHNTPKAQSIITSANNSIAAQQGRLALFGGKSSKTSLSSNSLNSNNSNSYNNNGHNLINNGHNIFNNNNSTSNNSISTMNNTQQQDGTPVTGPDTDQVTSSERKPKPVRGVGFGDIFAAAAAAAGKSKPLPANPTVTVGGIATERLSTMNTNSLQKQIPKKPPPPTPTGDGNNGTPSSSQAPALPPKPSNQYSPHLQHSRPLPTLHQPQQHQSLPQPPSSHMWREQARVIYAYEPMNDDELAMEVGDIITVLDKNIEDAGWWKGERRGKIGVFPDNFVQLIEASEAPSLVPNQDQWATNRNSATSQPSLPPTPSIGSEPGKLKSVFAATPKGFSKELENNLEKHSNPAASFLSLKRNKLHQQAGESTMNEESKSREEETSSGISSGADANSPSKLNHITANRARGPTRRPPTKRNQIDGFTKPIDINGREQNLSKSLDSAVSTTGTSSLVTSTTTAQSQQHHQKQQQTTNHDPLPSLPAASGHQTMSVIGSFPPRLADALPESNSIKTSMSMNNVIDDTNQMLRTSMRSNQSPSVQDKTKTASTPPWMVELRKATAERKRETPLGSVGSANDDDNSPTKGANNELPAISRVAESATTPNNIPSTPTTTTITESLISSQLISKNVTDLTNELNELKGELGKMRLEMKDMKQLKDTVEIMKNELKACQSATENQKRYIKDLVNNLADERKKIAAMQTELERNLK